MVSGAFFVGLQLSRPKVFPLRKWRIGMTQPSPHKAQSPRVLNLAVKGVA
jgi:hypothetical protein